MSKIQITKAIVKDIRQILRIRNSMELSPRDLRTKAQRETMRTQSIKSGQMNSIKNRTQSFKNQTSLNQIISWIRLKKASSLRTPKINLRNL